MTTKCQSLPPFFIQLDVKTLPHLRRDVFKPASLYDALGEGCRLYIDRSLGSFDRHDPHSPPEHLASKMESKAYAQVARDCNHTMHVAQSALEAAYYGMHRDQMDLYFSCFAQPLAHYLAQKDTQISGYFTGPLLSSLRPIFSG